MTEITSTICYAFITIFGVFLSGAFTKADIHKNNIIKLVLLSALLLIVQYLLFLIYGVRFVYKIYPLIVHLPLVLVLTIFFKKHWLHSLIAVLSAYLCCQIPHWLASQTYLFSDTRLYYNLLYICLLPTTYFIIKRYVAEALVDLINRSCLSCPSGFSLAALPLLYYIFDYSATVYTDTLYSGHPLAVQFMPFITALTYFLFLTLYHSQLIKQERAIQERDLLSLQLRQSDTEFYAIQQIQEYTNEYRHDLRHHFSLLTLLAEKGDLAKIKEYLAEHQQVLDNVTTKTFCAHKVINLLLSHFTHRAEQMGITLVIIAEVPPELPFNDSEICSILSNSLENALLATNKVTQAEKIITLNLKVRQKNLLISLANPYEGTITLVNGLPITKKANHGYGSKAIAAIVKHHHGQLAISTDNNIFLLRVMLPLE